MDYNNPLHLILFYEYLTYSVEVMNNEIRYINSADVNNWNNYFPKYTMQYVEDLAEFNVSDIWKDNLSESGVEAVKIFINKGHDYHHHKVGHALIHALLEGEIDGELKLSFS